MRIQKVTVSLPRDVLELADCLTSDVSEQSGIPLTRSQVIALAIREVADRMATGDWQPFQSGTTRARAPAGGVLSYPVLCTGESEDAKKSRPPKLAPSKSMLVAEITELREKFEDPDQVDQVLALMAHHLKQSRITFSRQKRLLQEWQTVVAAKGETWVQACFDVLLDRTEVPRKPEPFLRRLLKDGVESKGGNGKQATLPRPASRDPTIPEGYPPDIYDSRRWAWSEVNKAWFPLNEYGKPDWGSRKRWAYREGMKRP